MAIYRPSQAEVAEILEKHRLWLESGGEAGARANLARANLARANLADANLAHANLADAYLADAYLAHANLARANLAGANLAGANKAELALSMTEIVPREGSFIGWKKCRGDRIVKLRIEEDSKRSNATGRKCRASKVTVLDITDGDRHVEEAVSSYDGDFVYRVGETVEVHNFDDNRLNECAPGIHFYLTPEEAQAHLM